VSLLACAPDSAAPAAADDNPSDELITWAPADSPIDLTESFTIAADQELRVEPGVEVRLGPDVSLEVQGTLTAQGTDDAVIRFTRLDPDAAWGPLRLTASATPATYENLDDYVSGSIIEHVEFDGAWRALELLGASPYVHASNFHDNAIPPTVDEAGGAAILVTDGSSARIRGNTFLDNGSEIFAFGGAVYIAHSNPVL
jgi:hypothetical protein